MLRFSQTLSGLKRVGQLRLQSSFTIPKVQKGVIFNKFGGPLLYREDLPVPTPASNEVLINVKYSGVCHTDLHTWKGEIPFKTKLPLVGGHEGAGVVVAKGKDVKTFEIGDLAGVKQLVSSCMGCESCEIGHEFGCEQAEMSGSSHDGTFQQYVAIDALQAPPLPANVDLAAVAPIFCAGVSVYKALKNGNLQTNQWVAIFGATGGLGSIAVQYAKAMGYRVLGIDGPGEERKQLFHSLGGEVFLDYTQVDNIPAAVKQATQGGAHCVLNVTASLAAYDQTIKCVRPLGTVVPVGVPPDSGLLKTDIFTIVQHGFSIKGSASGSRADTREAVDFFTRGLIKSPIKILGLSELPKAFELLESGQTTGRLVLDTSK
ncbi:hypothetical protein ZYGR_0Z01380 [Zygosaccharomyces rouxii]|uniref:alcohol dehydrogenase n=2 Tax=Zygosaccharomyces rouxii TaxID=4956 RepID=C5DZD3_ZYGRC|nr:uncharacterized protein ZYRO0G03410g [Zygosaccharomyces rouxii]KAH9202216.1 chaperonin 10-like protein [Zygosaccharomyces rouxii]GAV50715.1 hypothetical protein ZYGR_0Z01380 [Zygosaccharomyces rouxii]CAR29217.1 ZYRO0G03410p [Zygosaccharomyces rouxii]